MELMIGENIWRLRRTMNLTQEELAERLGVSFQAVSKWERGEGLPDILFLPVLACFFRIAIDELIGMDRIHTQTKLDEINMQWEKNNIAGFHKQNVALMREALRLFPDDALLLVQLSTSLEKTGETDEERAAYLMESIEAQERILALGDSEVRNATQFNICHSYWKHGDRARAIAQAEKLPNLYKCRENVLASFLDGEKQLQISHAAYERIAWVLFHHLYTSAKNMCLNTDERVKCLNKLKEMLACLFDEEIPEQIAAYVTQANSLLTELAGEK